MGETSHVSLLAEHSARGGQLVRPVERCHDLPPSTGPMGF